MPVLPVTAVPVLSLRPQRPSRLAPEKISPLMPSEICCAVRATPQMRTSSIAPLKKCALAAQHLPSACAVNITSTLSSNASSSVPVSVEAPRCRRSHRGVTPRAIAGITVLPTTG
jgi:hypothetical protein